MSTIIANRWVDTELRNKVYVAQTVTQTTTAIGSTGSNSNSLGSNSTYNSAPTSTSGGEILSFTFQPRYADSKIFIRSSTIGVIETSNVADDFRLFVHANTDLLLWNYSGIIYFNSANNNQNFGLLGLCGVVNSWGTTSRTIRFGIDASGSGSNFRFNHRDVASWQPAPLSITFTEILV